jgi:hypothetical protein
VIDLVTSQATRSIERSLRGMLGEINLVGLCRQCSRFWRGRAGSSRSDRRRRLTDHADCRLAFRAKRRRRLARRWWCAVWESCIHPGVKSATVSSVVCERYRNARLEDWRADKLISVQIDSFGWRETYFKVGICPSATSSSCFASGFRAKYFLP